MAPNAHQNCVTFSRELTTNAFVFGLLALFLIFVFNFHNKHCMEIQNTNLVINY